MKTRFREVSHDDLTDAIDGMRERVRRPSFLGPNIIVSPDIVDAAEQEGITVEEYLVRGLAEYIEHLLFDDN